MKVGAKNLNLFKNLEKEKIMFCVQYVVLTLALDMVVKMTSTNSTPKHKQFFDSTQNKKNLSNWDASRPTANLDEKVTKSKLLFAGFIVEHNLPIATADHAGKLFRAMFPDSKIANKYKSGWTKTTHMLTGAVSKQTTDNLKEELSMTWYRIATDGSNDDNDKHLPILIRHVGKTSGLIETSLLDIPNINSGSTVQQIFNECNEVIEHFSLDWNKCVTYSSDNIKSMVGSQNSLLKKIRTLKQN